MTATIIVNVLFGTVTGNAEEIARTLFEKLPDHNVIQGVMCCLSDWANVPAFQSPLEHNYNTYNVIVASTTGDGDPPDTIRPFMRLLRSKEKDRLNGLNYTVLALGDTNYENFCKTGKRIDIALAKLGAEKFYARGEADDGTGLENVVEPWLKKLYQKFDDLNGSSIDSEDADEETKENSNTTTKKDVSDNNKVILDSKDIGKIVEEVASEELKLNLPPIPTPKFYTTVFNGDATDKKLPSVHPSFNDDVCHICSVRDARMLTTEQSEKVVWHMELNCEDAKGGDSEEGKMKYRPGDAFGIIVQNNEEEVQRFLTVNGYIGNEAINMFKNDTKASVFEATTIQRVVSERIDIRSIPSKTLLHALSKYTSNDTERQRLQLLSSRDGRAQYTGEISKKGMTLLSLLETVCPSVDKVPIDTYLNLTPAVPLRWYSATSSCLLDGDNVIHFAFSVVSGGLATPHLAAQCASFLSAGRSVDNQKPILLIPRESDNQSHFHPPPSMSTGYIMVGPGTGVAPFRGFLRERQYMLSETPDAEPGTTMLFFGCRHESKDFLYKDDLNELVSNGTLSQLATAFSRDTDAKVYVQHKLTERADDVAKLIQDGGSVYVCGDGGAMAVDVNDALTRIVTEHLCSGDDAKGKAYIKDLSTNHRYVRDIWYFG